MQLTLNINTVINIITLVLDIKLDINVITLVLDIKLAINIITLLLDIKLLSSNWFERKVIYRNQKNWQHETQSCTYSTTNNYTDCTSQMYENRSRLNVCACTCTGISIQGPDFKITNIACHSAPPSPLFPAGVCAWVKNDVTRVNFSGTRRLCNTCSTHGSFYKSSFL
jgi:hypothetical protein